LCDVAGRGHGQLIRFPIQAACHRGECQHRGGEREPHSDLALLGLQDDPVGELGEDIGERVSILGPESWALIASLNDVTIFTSSIADMTRASSECTRYPATRLPGSPARGFGRCAGNRIR
jgi:hypothetical protein